MASEYVSNGIEKIFSSLSEKDNKLTLENVRTNPLITATDSDICGLTIYCHSKCDEMDSPLLKKCRSVVFDEQGHLVSQSFTFSEEVVASDLEKMKTLFNGNITSARIMVSKEGCVIRMFNYQKEWYITTRRKLNANASRWGCRDSFGKMFTDAIEAYTNNDMKHFTKGLNTKYTYCFLLTNNSKNRLVCTPSVPQAVYHVGTFEGENILLDEKTVIPKPDSIQNMTSEEELQTVINNLDYTTCQGVFVYLPNIGYFKIFNDTYHKYLKIRGNESSVRFRYVQLMRNTEDALSLRELFPDMCSDFDRYDRLVTEASVDIEEAFIARYVNKKFARLPQDEYSVLKTVNSVRIKDRKKVTSESIRALLLTQHPSVINQIIRRRRIEENKREEEKDEEDS